MVVGSVLLGTIHLMISLVLRAPALQLHLKKIKDLPGNQGLHSDQSLIGQINSTKKNKSIFPFIFLLVIP